MNHKHHILELEKAIEHIKAEPVQNWIGKMAKSVKIRKIQKKIDSLKKEHANKHGLGKK